MPQRAWFEAKPISEFRWYGRMFAPIIRFWGRLRTGQWKRTSRPHPPLPLAEEVARFGGPVFGMVDECRGLMQFGSEYGDGVAFQLNFSAGPVNDPATGINLQIKSVLTREVLAEDLGLASMGHKAWWSMIGVEARQRALHQMQDVEPFPSMRDFPLEIEAKTSLAIEGFVHIPRIHRWRTPAGVVHAMSVEMNDWRLRVSTFGFETDELTDIFSHIGRVDDKPEVLSRYEAETRARQNELGWRND